MLIMDDPTIKINEETKAELTKEAIESIEKARERIKKGKFLTSEEARKRLGI